MHALHAFNQSTLYVQKSALKFFAQLLLNCGHFKESFPDILTLDYLKNLKVLLVIIRFFHARTIYLPCTVNIVNKLFERPCSCLQSVEEYLYLSFLYFNTPFRCAPFKKYRHFSGPISLVGSSEIFYARISTDMLLLACPPIFNPLFGYSPLDIGCLISLQCAFL